MPGLFFSPVNRYILSWVMDRYKSDRYLIANSVSTDSSATGWNSPYTYGGGVPGYPDFVSSVWQPPAIECLGQPYVTWTCQMLYKQFRTSDSAWINQQGFQMNSGYTRLETVTTDFITWDQTYAHISVAAGDGIWVYTHVENTAAEGKMWYRIKPFSKGVGGDYRYYPTQYNSSMMSISGFPVAYNYRTGYFRFIWYDE